MDKTDDNHLNQNSNDALEWVPLSLTLVEYPKGDWFGKLLAMISLLPFAIGSGFIALILFRKDLHTVMFFLGTIFNEILNIILKHAICEPRPLLRNSLYNEYGMPSSHSQFIWFFVTYIAYFIFIRLHYMDNLDRSIENLGKAALVLACLLLAVTVSFSRIYLQYHSGRQVIFGALIGIVFGSVWFALTHLVLTPLFPTIVTWKISEFLLIRDSTLIPNILWFEYANIRQEARVRSRKLVSMKSQ